MKRTRLNVKRIQHLMIDMDIGGTGELAAKAGLAENTVYRALAGENFTRKTLDAIAVALDCNPLDILDTEDHPAPHMGAPALAVQ